MYNIHSHYNNLFNLLRTLTKDPVLLYFFPFGSTHYDNIEYLHCNGDGRSVVFLCYDQEPINEHTKNIFQTLRDQYRHRHVVLLNTESNSIAKNISDSYNFNYCYYFFHIFAAADWFRGYQYDISLIPPRQRSLSKKFITFNRITGNSRAYRSIFIAELHKNNLLNFGHISYSDTCPEHGHYSRTIFDLNISHGVDLNILNHYKEILDSINYPLRIDFKNEVIQNRSFELNTINEMMESFLHVVTETCFWENKEHLTEKIFKPIVAKQPFILLGCKNNLKYLKRYGFQTFDKWWDESYDDIDDPILRIQSAVRVIKKICDMSLNELEALLQDMDEVLTYNYNWFYNQDFISKAWNELEENLKTAIPQHLLLNQLKI